MKDEVSRTRYILISERHKDLPLVDIVLVNSRGANAKWFRQAYSSALEQTYAHCGLVVVDNNDHTLTIGAARNVGVAASSAKYVLFLDDDDYISIDLAAHLASTFEKLLKRKELSDLVLVTSGMTLVDDQDQLLSDTKKYDNGTTGIFYMQMHHTGMYLRTWMERNPADPTLQRYVTTAMQRDATVHGQRLGRRTTWATSYHYGYHYRQHIGQVSGQKLVRV